MKIYSVLDIKAGVYSPLMSFPNSVYAIRAFESMVNQPDTNINRYPFDFVLHYLGEMDDNTGMIKPVPPTVVVVASDFIKE